MKTFKDISVEQIRTLPVYKQIEESKHEDSVLIELEKLAGTSTLIFNLEEGVAYCFHWESSPQGHGYWRDINKNI